MTDPRERAARREFVRRAHPDVGGDHDEFVAGLARLRAAAEQSDPDGRRWDGPVVGDTRPGGVFGLTDRVRRWHSRRFRKPRVR
ncbi:hypothetical protein L6E12_20545 [Actinokineospora sp. PR83]|uniref:hypothetical protein n=1 Tax=Actinokineospora sp. PR83 TaxID=2884908 RepID=UPI001F15FB8A|nr:hypothetical protein [Actinokineospora sp. PR83]MCG8918176.1 hypothetical protein [Actinokineospora sp. PR83]